MTLEEYELYELTKPSFILNVNFSTEAKHRDPIEPLVQGRNGIPQEKDTPVEETRVVCVYNITTTEEPTLLLLGEDVSCFRPDVDIYKIFSGMEIDGVEQELDLHYQFNTTGEHVIKYTLNDDVTNFEAVFFNVDNLSSIIIPNNVTIIDEYAFDDCINLKSIIIGNSVTSIERSALEGCINLESIIIGKSVTSIDPETPFRLGKLKLNSIIVNDQNNKYDSRNNCNAIIETANNKLIVGCKNTIIPNSIISIGDYAFYGCTGLTSVVIPNSVTSIEYYAFSGCTGLTSVTIGNSVTSIESSVFYGCTGLTSITIPNSVTNIGDNAFRLCTNLISVTINNSVPPTLGTYTFNSNANNRKIYVPAESVNTYKTATNWSTYADDIEAIS